MPAAFRSESAIGRAPEELELGERLAWTGKWIALEVYTPATLPLRRIQAIGDSVAECIRQLETQSLDPERFEFSVLQKPY